MNVTIAIVSIVASIAALLLLIVRLKVHPYIAMTGVAIVLAIVFRIPVNDPDSGVFAVIEGALGPALAHILPLVGLGCIISEIISRSGGSALLGHKLLSVVGEKHGVSAIIGAGLLVGSTIFFDTAVILLAPVAIAVARQSGRSAAIFAVPMAIAVLCVHAILPPHPGAVAVASALGVDYGLLIVFGLGTMLPGAALACLWAGWELRRLESRGLLTRIAAPVEDGPGMPPATSGIRALAHSGRTSPAARATSSATTVDAAPGMLVKLILVLVLPVVLILIATVAKMAGTDTALEPVLSIARFIGTPVLALLITTVVAFLLLMPRSARRVTGLTEVGRVGLRPVGEIVLSTGGGVAFGGVIAASGIGAELVSQLQAVSLPLVVFGFVLAAVLRATLGTTTAAVTTVATLLATTLDLASLGPIHVALLAVSISAGGVCLSHVNDAGFWVLSRYFDISEKTMLLTWTVGVTIMGVVTAVLATVLWFVIPGVTA